MKLWLPIFSGALFIAPLPSDAQRIEEMRHVPLSKSAIGVIEQLPRFEKCPYLVPNPETKKPFPTYLLMSAFNPLRSRPAPY